MIMYDKKKPTQKKVSKKVKKRQLHPVEYLQLGLAVLTIFGIIYFSIYQNNRKNYTYIKVDKNSPLVITRFDNENSKYPITVPYININTEEIKNINSEILTFSQALASKKKSVILYEYEVNGEILSLVLTAIDNSTDIPKIDFKTYNIDLKDAKVLTNDEILNLYGITSADVEKVLENKFKKYYQEELQAGYLIEQECNYDCFLRYREITSYLENVKYYISNKNLVAYKPFATQSIYGEEEFYADETFGFQITSSEQES